MNILKKLQFRLGGVYGKHLLQALQLYKEKRTPQYRELCGIAWRRFLLGERSVNQAVEDYYRRWYCTPGAPSANEESQPAFIQFGPFKFTHCHFIKPLLEDVPNFYNDAVPLEFIILFELDFAACSGSYFWQDVDVKPGDIVIDAGANMGLFSMAAAKKGAKVYAFEPQQQILEILRRNIALNGFEEQITICPIALSNQNGKVTFKEFTDSSTNSRLADMSSGVWKDGQDQHFKVYDVKTQTLDSWAQDNHIEKINFIKSDIEGSERYLLEGAQQVLAQQRPKLSLCTYHLPDDPQVMEALIRKARPDYELHHTETLVYGL